MVTKLQDPWQDLPGFGSHHVVRKLKEKMKRFPRRKRGRRQAAGNVVSIESLERRELLTGVAQHGQNLQSGDDVVLSEDFENLDEGCWDDHLESNSGYNVPGCDGFVNIGDGQNLQLVETADARSGSKALQVTYEVDEDQSQAVYRFEGTDYVRTTQHMRFNDSFDFGFGQKIHRIFSVDENEDVNFDIVVIAWGKALDGKADTDLSGVNGETRSISINYNGGKAALEWGAAWKDGFIFERETWHKITSEVQLNTVGVADGWVRLFVDDVLVAEKYDLEIRDSADHKINQALFGGWYSNSAAGQNPQRDPASPTSLLIDDISVATTPNESKPLGNPTILTPAGNQTTSPEVSWFPVEGANEYEVRLTNLDTSVVVLDEITTQTSLAPPSELADGAWQVQVRARNSDSVSEWTSSRFDIQTSPDQEPSFLEIDGNKLIVRGSNSSDVITTAESADSLSVTVNGRTETLPARGIDSIIVWSLDGADEVTRTGDTSRKAVIYAGPGDDTILGGTGSDVVRAGSGADVIEGLGGDDVIRAGSGDDSIFGGTGDDTLNGGSGSDSLYGEDGNDLLRGHNGRDHLFGGFGDDELDGGRGDDLINGETGSDRLTGDVGRNLLIGGDDSDWIDATSGDDLVVSGLTTAEPDQLTRIASQWGSRQDYDSRIERINGITASPFQGDSSVNELLSSDSDIDWFFASTVDSISGRTMAEELDLL